MWSMKRSGIESGVKFECVARERMKKTSAGGCSGFRFPGARRVRTKSDVGALLPWSKGKGGGEWSNARLFVDASIHLAPAPNKAPEPTPTAVTPRAIAIRNFNTESVSARVAPAVGVAHL